MAGGGYGQTMARERDEKPVSVWRCRVLGHRPRFRSESSTMVWECERGCGFSGSKSYPTAEEARRYAAAFDKRDGQDLGRRAPLIGLFPLRLWHRFRGR